LRENEVLALFGFEMVGGLPELTVAIDHA